MTIPAFQSKLSDANEYAILVWGQSNSRAWGHRNLEGFVAAPHLNRFVAGKDLTIVAVVPFSLGTPGAAGEQSILFVAETLDANVWIGAEFRCYRTDHTEATPSLTRVVPTESGTATLVSGNLRITQTGGDLTKRFAVGDQATVAGWTKGVGDEVNVRHVVVAVTTTTVDLRLCRGTYSSITAVTAVGAKVTRQTAATFGYGKVTTNTANQLLVTWTVDTDVANLVAGHVHTRGNWKTIPTVKVLTPYCPPEPGAFPAGTPTLPGMTLATGSTGVAGFDQLGLFLDYTWDEGIEGMGQTGTLSAVSSLVATIEGGGDMLPNFYADGYVVILDSEGRMTGRGEVASNTATTLTVRAWIGTAPPAEGGVTYKVWAPHWRDNPHAFTAGKGFLQPSNEPQPTPFSALGWCYDRPLDRRSPGYVACARTNAPCDATINTSLVARVQTSALSAVKVGGASVGGDPTRLRISRTDAGTTPSSQAIQFENIVRAGDLVTLAGWTISSGTFDINGLWRVRVVEPVSGGSGSYVDLDPAGAQAFTGTVRTATLTIATPGVFTLVGHALALNTAVVLSTTGALPTGLLPNVVYYVKTAPTADTFTLSATPGGTVIDTTGSQSGVHSVSSGTLLSATSATAGATTSVTRLFQDRQFRMGAMVELAFQLSTKIGRPIRVIHLSCNSASQTLQQINQAVGFQGQIGWWDFRKDLDWTPARNDGMAGRLDVMLQRMAKNALTPEGLAAKPLKIIGIFGFQGEGDALTQVGRDNYAITLRTFYDWLLKRIAAAGLAPGGKVPIVHPLITAIPWEMPTNIPGGGGDVKGQINAAISALAADTSYTFRTFRTDSHPKLYGSTLFGTDPLHFNGQGEVFNADKSADIWAEAAASLA